MSPPTASAEEAILFARQALAEGREREALPMLERAAKASPDPSLYQWIGLLNRSIDRLGPAIAAFDEAANLAPQDGLIALSRARVALEAGLDARGFFDRALMIQPSADVLLGRAAARYAMGDGDAALEELGSILSANPDWADGHIHWAQLAAMTGHTDRCTETVVRALKSNTASVPLWRALLEILIKADRHGEAAQRCADATASTGDATSFALTLAACLSDAGELDRADDAFRQLGPPRDVHHAVHVARLHIRRQELAPLLMLTETWMSGADGHHFWPYASIAWRLAEDPRWQWLEGDEQLIRQIDLSEHIGPIDELGDVLRGLHRKSGRFLDQSVRGGTQTDGALLSRIEPEIQRLRAAIVSAVEAYRNDLPPLDPHHPMLRYRRDGDVRFAGSWSVRLSGAGHHSNHVHPAGWISSAFYVAVPDGIEGEEGWLSLGQPQAELGLSLLPIRKIRPQPGHLVLFPSMMWHGTKPFTRGERMTVAFDVIPPRQ